MCVQVQEERLLGWSVGVRILFLAVGMVKEFNSRAGIAACLKVGDILLCVSWSVNEFGIAASLVTGGILQYVSSYVNTLGIVACFSVGDSFQ